jgi:hypothetical protein
MTIDLSTSPSSRSSTATGSTPSAPTTRSAASRLKPPALHNRLDDLINGSHDGWFTTKLGAKDVRLAGDLAE